MLLRKRAEELVDLMEKTKTELTSSNDHINGDIYIGCGLLVGGADINKYDYLKLPQKDLWDKPLIISHQASINTEMFQWLKADISKLNIVATYDLIYNAAQFVRKGFGYVIALDKLINTTGDSNLCFRPLSPTLEAELIIVWKKYQVLSRASRIFLQQLKSEA